MYKTNKKAYSVLALTAVLAFSTSVYAQSESGSSSKSKKGLDTSQMIPVDQIKAKGVKFREKWPKNFPVPPYPRNVTRTTFIHTTQGAASASANLITSDKPASVYHWYKKVLERDKWKINAPKPQKLGKGMTIYLLDAVKGYNQVTLNIIKSTNPIAPGTSCSINWTFNRK